MKSKIWPFKPSKQVQFEQLIKPHLSRLYKLAFRLCGNKADAEDLVQDVVLKLFPKLDEMLQLENLSAWLAKVVYRHFVDKHRAKQRSPLHLVDNQDNDDGQLEIATANTTENTDDLQNQLQQALNTLNEDQKTLVLLHDVEGYTLVEIQSILDVSLGTLKSRLSRARTKLKLFLIKKEPFNETCRVNG